MRATLAPTCLGEKEGELHFHIADVAALERVHNAYPTGFVMHLKNVRTAFCLTEDSFAEVRAAFIKFLGES